MEKFSWRKRFRSFRFAGAGLRLVFKTEHNAWFHFGATIVVIILAFIYRVSVTESALLAVAVGLVWMAELFNTCIEKIMDFISKENRSEIKLIKDISAGAVLAAAVIALIIGCLVFIPKIFHR
jgi:diacylglycerol kinase (ATP)